jgi:hypothetical protein
LPFVSQLMPSGRLVTTQPASATHAACAHTEGAVQATAVPRHAPLAHASSKVHPSPSSHEAEAQSESAQSIIPSQSSSSPSLQADSFAVQLSQAAARQVRPPVQVEPTHAASSHAPAMHTSPAPHAVAPQEVG